MRLMLFLFIALMPTMLLAVAIHARYHTRPVRVEKRVRKFLYELNGEYGIDALISTDLYNELQEIIKSLEE